MSRQKQFLSVVDRDEATRRFHEHLSLSPLDSESVPLSECAGRTLSSDVCATVDVTAFDRANVDGFAVVAASTVGAAEQTPVMLRLNEGTLTPGVEPRSTVETGSATAIATGAVVPRGADAIVMVEDTDLAETADGTRVRVTRAAVAGEFISHAGTDIALGEVVLRSGQLLTSREIGVLAAIGRVNVDVCRRPRVAIVSTGNEIVPPGSPLPIGCVYDSNQAILSAAVRELGAEPVPLGIVRDDVDELRDILKKASAADLIVLSGGTSKGEGDLCYSVVSELTNPGIVAHGVSLKPGKPVCLAVDNGRPVVVLPGFPTSAVFTFHEFVAPVIRALVGRSRLSRKTTSAELAIRLNSARGRTEYLLVHLIERSDGLVAYPMGKGSGSVTAFSMADGFVAIDQHTEIVAARDVVDVTLLSESLTPADLVVIGSHCRGLDVLLGEMHARGFSTKTLHVGSLAGIEAARRGECDVAGCHLLDPESGQYNQAWLTEEEELLRGYRRRQGIVFRPGDTRFEGRSVANAVRAALSDSDCLLVNRNRGSGTRIVIDGLLDGARPPGFAIETRSHNAACAAVAQGRADWSVAIEPVALEYGLNFLFVRAEEYDFVVPRSCANRPPVDAFRAILCDAEIRRRLSTLGFEPHER